MSQRRKLLKGGGMLMGGQVLGQALSFIRNVVVARLISPEDFGIAATFVLAVSMLEMISYLAVERLLVQAEDGNEPAFQAAAHTFQVLRAIVIALFLFLLAWPFSKLFGIPQALWAFQCVALVPLIRGFVHLDIKRLHREFRFGADVASGLIPQILLVLAAWPFAWWFKDYSAMLWLLIFQAVVLVLVSHLFAKRRYTWAWDRVLFSRMFSFGWPLLFSGLLMFLILQGDHLIIGGVYDMTQLGIYSVAFSLTSVPSMMIGKAVSALLLPLLSKTQRDLKRFTARYALSVYGLCLLGVMVATSFIFLGQRVVVLTYGSKYAGVGAFIGWLAITHMLRTIRLAPTTASMAFGDTVAPLITNIARAAVLPLGIVAALLGKPLVWLVIFGCVGEVVAITVLLTRLYRLHGLEIGLCFKPVGIALIAVGIAQSTALTMGIGSWMFSIGLIVVIAASTFGIMAALLPSFRGILKMVFSTSLDRASGDGKILFK
jgi:O-antigen/teichoic acid export membrane protein